MAKNRPAVLDLDDLEAVEIGCDACGRFGRKGLIEVHLVERLDDERVWGTTAMVRCDCRPQLPEGDSGKSYGKAAQILSFRRYLEAWCGSKHPDHRALVEQSENPGLDAAKRFRPSPTGISATQAMQVFNRTWHMARERGYSPAGNLYSNRYD